MHELSLMQSALDIVEEQARLSEAKRVHRVTMRVGRLAGVEPEALAFAFEAVTAGTIAEGAVFMIESVPVVCFCAACGKEFAPPDFIFACPDCGALSQNVRAGQELDLVEVEVSDDVD